MAHCCITWSRKGEISNRESLRPLNRLLGGRICGTSGVRYIEKIRTTRPTVRGDFLTTIRTQCLKVPKYFGRAIGVITSLLLFAKNPAKGRLIRNIKIILRTKKDRKSV